MKTFWIARDKVQRYLSVYTRGIHYVITAKRNKLIWDEKNGQWKDTGKDLFIFCPRRIHEVLGIRLKPGEIKQYELIGK